MANLARVKPRQHRLPCLVCNLTWQYHSRAKTDPKWSNIPNYHHLSQKSFRWCEETCSISNRKALGRRWPECIREMWQNSVLFWVAKSLENTILCY